MSFLKTLTFTTANDLIPSPIEKKRQNLVAGLKDQLALLDQPDLTKSRKRWVEVDGERILTQKTIPVRPWWRVMNDGKMMLFVRSGVRRLEFDKGKSAIIAANTDELQKLLKGLIDATQNGELDHLLDVKLKPVSAPKPKAA